MKKLTYDIQVLIVLKKEKGCLMFKRDLKRAYREIPIDPGNMILDRVLSMGLRSAAQICQRITSSKESL